MPMIDLTYPEGALAPDARADLVERLTTLVLEQEGVPDNPHSRLFSWCHVHELPGELVHVGGRVADRPTYRVLIAVPDSTLIHGRAPWATARRRSIVRQVTEAVLAAEGTEYSPAEGWRVWVVIEEVADGFWGMAGRLFRFEDLVSFMAPDQVKTRVGEHLRQAADAVLAEEEASVSAS